MLKVFYWLTILAGGQNKLCQIGELCLIHLSGHVAKREIFAPVDGNVSTEWTYKQQHFVFTVGRILHIFQGVTGGYRKMWNDSWSNAPHRICSSKMWSSGNFSHFGNWGCWNTNNLFLSFFFLTFVQMWYTFLVKLLLCWSKSQENH